MSGSPSDLGLAGGGAFVALETLTEITCPACPSCRGGIYLIYDDETTSSISVGDGPEHVQAALTELGTLGTSSVYGNITWINATTSGGASLCDASSAATTRIRLRSPHGNLPDFTVVTSVRDAAGDAVALNVSSGRGTKENEYCSNHGLCDFATGTCLCDRNTTKFPDEWYWWESSDGYGGPGGRGDCGYQRVESATNTSQGCPVGVVFTNETMPTLDTMDQARPGKDPPRSVFLFSASRSIRRGQGLDFLPMPAAKIAGYSDEGFWAPSLFRLSAFPPPGAHQGAKGVPSPPSRSSAPL